MFGLPGGQTFEQWRGHVGKKLSSLAPEHISPPTPDLRRRHGVFFLSAAAVSSSQDSDARPRSSFQHDDVEGSWRRPLRILRDREYTRRPGFRWRKHIACFFVGAGFLYYVSAQCRFSQSGRLKTLCQNVPDLPSLGRRSPLRKIPRPIRVETFNARISAQSETIRARLRNENDGGAPVPEVLLETFPRNTREFNALGFARAARTGISFLTPTGKRSSPIGGGSFRF